MRTLDARRLTGLSRWADGHGAAVVIEFARETSEVQRATLRATWQRNVTDAMAVLGWPAPSFDATAAGRGGRREVWVASAPIDRLYAAVALCESAANESDSAAHLAAARAEDDIDGDAALLGAERFAAERHLPFLWCDDEASIGWGTRSQVWDRAEVPADLTGLDAESLGRIPVALVTGTNGKTTTSRLLSRIARHAGFVVGATGTDGLVVDEQVIEAGDWTGPGGARTVLRDGRVELAVLEAARGGMLRRGLGTTGVDAAAVTNVSNDHLGEWGIDSVAHMAEVKLLVGKAVRPGGRLVLFDDGAALTSCATGLAATDNLVVSGVEVLRYRADNSASDGPGRLAAWLADEGATLVVDCGFEGRGPLRIPASEVPITVGGAARYNVANALAAGLLARGLGLPDDAIRSGLASFQPNSVDSPGRGNLLTVRGAKVILDFGHNPDGVMQVAHMAARLNVRRRLVVTGQAGDRTDGEIRGLVEGLSVCKPDRWLLKAMPKYVRGRPLGEVVAVLRSALTELGVPEGAVTDHPTEREAVDAAIAELQPGDLLLLFIQADAAGALAQLREAGATDGW